MSTAALELVVALINAEISRKQNIQLEVSRMTAFTPSDREMKEAILTLTATDLVQLTKIQSEVVIATAKLTAPAVSS